MSLSGWEIPLVVLLALLFFGGKKLPELARGFGESIRTFKNEVKKDDDLETEKTTVAKKTVTKKSDKKNA